MAAQEWRQASLCLEENHFSGKIVFALYAFSSELFLKALLIHCGRDFSTSGGKGHDILYLFNLLPPKIQDAIKKQIEFEPLEDFYDDEMGNFISGYNTFAEAVFLISNDFYRLRYSCELFSSFQSFNVYTGFSQQFNRALAIIANQIVVN